jgi:hypothetical protein
MDSHSVCSTTSVSNAKVECPICECEITQKVLFGHLMKKHKMALELSVEKESVEEMIAQQLPFVAYNESGQSVRGCLGCHKGYNTDAKAKEHFKKDKDCFHSHVKELKKLTEALTFDENEVYKRLMAFLLPSMDWWLETEIATSPLTTTMDNCCKLLVHAKQLLESNEEQNWIKVVHRCVCVCDLVARTGQGSPQGFMTKVSKFKWLPSTKELNTLLPKDISIPTELKCVNALNKQMGNPYYIQEEISVDDVSNILSAIFG